MVLFASRMQDYPPSGGFMKTTKALLGERIKELRKKRQLSQEQLAEKIQIDAKNLSRIEVGRGYPSLDTLENCPGLGRRDEGTFRFPTPGVCRFHCIIDRIDGEVGPS